MEQWVSDTFFSYFPSFNKKQKEQKGALSRKRQEEYQEYLKNVNFIANAVNYLCFFGNVIAKLVAKSHLFLSSLRSFHNLD